MGSNKKTIPGMAGEIDDYEKNLLIEFFPEQKNKLFPKQITIQGIHYHIDSIIGDIVKLRKYKKQ